MSLQLGIEVDILSDPDCIRHAKSCELIEGGNTDCSFGFLVLECWIVHFEPDKALSENGWNLWLFRLFSDSMIYRILLEEFLLSRDQKNMFVRVDDLVSKLSAWSDRDKAIAKGLTILCISTPIMPDFQVHRAAGQAILWLLKYSGVWR